MGIFIFRIVLAIYRVVLSLRYKLTIRGLDDLKLDKKGGILFLGNHPSYFDPLIFFAFCFPKYRMRPLVVESMYYLPWLHPFLKIAKAIPIPDQEQINPLKIKRTERALAIMQEGLQNGDTIVLYPAGKIKSQGEELLGGASGAHDLVSKIPETNVVLIRLTGMWGSSFSKAITGTAPNLFGEIVNGTKTFLKNAIFFTPRREILLEFETLKDLPRHATRLEFNAYLENWYNQYKDKDGNLHKQEPLKLVPYKFWDKTLPKIKNQNKKKEIGHAKEISPQTTAAIYKEIQKILEDPKINITPEMTLGKDLGLDSLNIAKLITFLSFEYNVNSLHPEDLETVQNVLQLAEGGRINHLKTQDKTPAWPPEKNRPGPLLPMGSTLTEAFCNTCKQMGSLPAFGDDTVGVWSYKKLKKTALILAEYFLTMPDEKIAIMLPSSAAAYLLILATQFAGKTPVMLNWTLGPRYLEAMLTMSGAKRVITSEKFLDRLSHVDFGRVIDSIETLEEIRRNLTLKMKLKGLFFSSPSSLKPEDPAVILFTSGTEASPKAVPLSHKNILSNICSSIPCNDFQNTDVIYAFLPPFHSFGFVTTGFLPLLSGLRLAFSPDPTDSFALADGAEKWGATFICSAPNFLKALFTAATPKQLKTLRYFVVGAEKAPKDLYVQAKKMAPNAKLMEGYGVTECSPVVAVNRFDRETKGVGPPLPGVNICTIHPETAELLPKGSEGEICVQGESVFAGYLGKNKSPFIEINQLQWYRTGDIGYLDADDNIIISGRLKRFAKIGGEMISLGAIEETLLQECTAQNRINHTQVPLALSPIEKEDGELRLVLFVTFPIEKESVNKILREAGFSNLVKISQVEQIGEIPLIGSGKINYQELKKIS